MTEGSGFGWSYILFLFQGSFECVRSGGARRLESCGPLPRRMRVQANDDSYEATKDRMARTVAAEQSKWSVA